MLREAGLRRQTKLAEIEGVNLQTLTTGGGPKIVAKESFIEKFNNLLKSSNDFSLVSLLD
jgi:hypothetical protein